MERGALLAVGVACVVLLAGCAGFGTGPGSEATTTGGGPTATDAVATETATSSATTRQTTEETAHQTTQRTTQQTAEEWTSPQDPNTPFQNKVAEGAPNRIKNVAVTGGSESGDGYSSVELTVTANTSMPNVDPAEHGTVHGEPFFLVYVNSSLTNDTEYHPRFYLATGDPVVRDGVSFEANGTFTLSVSQAALDAGGAEAGEVELMVVLFDEDKAWDDIYGIGTVNVTYAPGE